MHDVVDPPPPSPEPRRQPKRIAAAPIPPVNWDSALTAMLVCYEIVEGGCAAPTGAEIAADIMADQALKKPALAAKQARLIARLRQQP